VNTRHKPARAQLGNPSFTAFSTAFPHHFVFSSLFRMLSPTIPVHPRNAPVSPIIPVHTQKQGGGALKKLSATSDQRSEGKNKAVPLAAFPGSPLACPPKLQRRRATTSNHSRTIGNCCPTSRARSNIYHHITYPCRRADIFVSRKSHIKSANYRLQRSAFSQLSTVDCALLFSPNSNYSRTYAKQGGWGIRMVTYLEYVGAPTFSFRERNTAIRRGKQKAAERFLSRFCGIGMTERRGPPQKAGATRERERRARHVVPLRERRATHPGRGEAERSLHCAARRTTIRCGRESRAAPVGMTGFGRVCFGRS
jgi:hypothetical protein